MRREQHKSGASNKTFSSQPSTVLRQELQARRKAPRIIGGRKAGKFIPGRRAGKDHARTQGPLRGERPSLPVCFARQSPSMASFAFGEPSSASR
ncbi:hypothetical protein Y696_09510 [Mesotoga sp. H07pep.5.4]|jgi:hypothetical protein|nr:hypothetical protein Y696_09510 [Mesotoga sp. H07pep.5.4]